MSPYPMPLTIAPIYADTRVFDDGEINLRTSLGKGEPPVCEHWPSLIIIDHEGATEEHHVTWVDITPTTAGVSVLFETPNGARRGICGLRSADLQVPAHIKPDIYRPASGSTPSTRGVKAP